METATLPRPDVQSEPLARLLEVGVSIGRIEALTDQGAALWELANCERFSTDARLALALLSRDTLRKALAEAEGIAA